MNRVLLSGRLTKDTQVSTYGENNEKKMARYTLAVDRGIRREEGQQNADFIGCVCYGKAADFADQYLRQGMKIIVEGRIQSGSYVNKDGQKVFTTDVLVDRHEFCESKRTADQGNQIQASTTPATVQTQAAGMVQKDESWMNIPEGITENLPWD